MLNIGDTIYLVFRESINKETVYMTGKESFAHSRTFDPNCLDEYRDELYMSEEGTKWFRTLKAAKDFLLKQYPKCKIVRVEPGYWELWEE